MGRYYLRIREGSDDRSEGGHPRNCGAVRFQHTRPRRATNGSESRFFPTFLPDRGALRVPREVQKVVAVYLNLKVSRFFGANVRMLNSW